MDIVTGAGFRVTKNLDGRKYTLRAPTFEEHGELVASANPYMRPTAAVLNEEVREALRRIAKPELAEVIDEHEAAEIAFQDARQQVPIGEADREALKEFNQAVSEARQRLLKADTARKRAEWLVREDKDLKAMRSLAQDTDRAEHLALVALCLVDWEGEGLPAKPDTITGEFLATALPAGDIAAIGQIAYRLLQPTKEVEGN